MSESFTAPIVETAIAPLPLSGPRDAIEPLQNVTLEISPKLFVPYADANLVRIMEETACYWRALLRHAWRNSILFWLGDGTDILEYPGYPDRRVEWAKWMGFAHTPYQVSL